VLFSNTPKPKLVYFLLPAVILATVSVDSWAQSTRSTGSRGQSTLPTSISVLEGTKDQDGLIGPVRSVRTETARLSLNSGKLTEGPRSLLETTAYSLEGQRIENTYYPIAKSDNPPAKEEYKYDNKGNVIQTTRRDQNGTILSKEVHTYEFDKVGNWKKMITFLMVYENGRLKYEPLEVTYRTILYYSDQHKAKVGNRGSPAAASPVVLPAETTRRATGSEAASLVKTQRVSADPGAPEARKIYEDSGGDFVMPNAIYPEEAKRAGVTGIVAVEVTMNPDGRVIKARAISGHPMLRASAEEAALKSRLPPGPKTPKKSVVITFTFSLLE
jgi:TonB family protein